MNLGKNKLLDDLYISRVEMHPEVPIGHGYFQEPKKTYNLELAIHVPTSPKIKSKDVHGDVLAWLGPF